VPQSLPPMEITESTPGSRALSGWPMIFAVLAMLIFTGHACTHMVAAGDTWVAMACGRHFVNHGVDTVEPFSAYSHKPGPTPEEVKTWPGWARWITEKVGLETVKKWHPTGWINQNWLTHVIFYSLVPKESYADGVSFPSNALVYWKFAVYIITVAGVFYTGVVLGVNPALSAVLACFAMFVGRSFLDIRPAGFSNMCVALFMLILVLTTYRSVRYIWLIVPLTVFWCNAHGGYIYVFIMLIPFIGIHLMAVLPRKWTIVLYNILAWTFCIILIAKTDPSKIPRDERFWAYFARFLFIVFVIVLDVLLVFFREKLVRFEPRAVLQLVGAYAVTFFAALIFNPFHLTNFTHTFVISVSEHAKRWRDIHEWHPAFEWSNPVGTAIPFAWMYGIAWVLLLAWVIVLAVAPGLVGNSARRRGGGAGRYEWPRVDVPLMFIAALTIYMAIRSRRFIPIAAYAACPVIAMFIEQIIGAVAAVRNFRRSGRLVVPAMPQGLQTVFTLAGAAAVVFFGTWWGVKFKHVYLDPWPNDTKLTSVFMRMTASDAKPFYAMKFIKDNKLKGKMFNYWTEGGFIAFGQEPDPNTGQTPLKLFMDGRAQAAYDRAAFDRWTRITAGGPIVARAAQTARLQGKRDPEDVLTSKDYVGIGQWVSEQLRKHQVWVVLMPAGQFSKPLTRGLEHNRDWPLVFLNNKQKLFVDIQTPQGRELFNGIFTGQTLYPDEFHRDMILGHSYLLHSDRPTKKRGLDYITKAFRAKPSPAPMLEAIIIGARYAELVPGVTKLCQSWYDDFTENMAKYANEHGYRLKLEAARLACVHLEKIARGQNNAALAETYRDAMIRFARERNILSATKRW